MPAVYFDLGHMMSITFKNGARNDKRIVSELMADISTLWTRYYFTYSPEVVEEVHHDDTINLDSGSDVCCNKSKTNNKSNKIDTEFISNLRLQSAVNEKIYQIRESTRFAEPLVSMLSKTYKFFFDLTKDTFFEKNWHEFSYEPGFGIRPKVQV